MVCQTILSDTQLGQALLWFCVFKLLREYNNYAVYWKLFYKDKIVGECEIIWMNIMMTHYFSNVLITHSILSAKLKSFNFCESTINWISSFLSDRTQAVKCNHSMSVYQRYEWCAARKCNRAYFVCFVYKWFAFYMSSL